MRHTSTAATIKALPALEDERDFRRRHVPEYPACLRESVRINTQVREPGDEWHNRFDEAAAPDVLLLVMRKFLALLAFALPSVRRGQTDQGDNDHISVVIDGKPFTDFFFGANTAKPYMWPLRAATGTVVTRGYPIDANVPGETHDHPHHRGLWFTHGDVNGYDFWANEPSQESPKEGPRGAEEDREREERRQIRNRGCRIFDWNAGDQTILEEIAEDGLLRRAGYARHGFRRDLQGARQR